MAQRVRESAGDSFGWKFLSSPVFQRLLTIEHWFTITYILGAIIIVIKIVIRIIMMMTTTTRIITIKMIVKYLEVPVPYLLPPFPPPAINFIASHIPPQWILSPSKPLSLPLTLSLFSFFSPLAGGKRLKKEKVELKCSHVQLSSDRVKAGSSQPALSLQSHFRAKGFKRYFQSIKSKHSTFQTYVRFFSCLNPLPRMHMSCYGQTP